MDTPPKPRGRPFQRGHKFSKGRPPSLPPELQRANAAVVQASLARIWLSTTDELLALGQNPEVSAGEKWLASVLLNGIKFGDHTRLQVFLDRLIGKVKEAPPADGDRDDNEKLPTVDEARQMLLTDYATNPPAEPVKVEEL